GSPDQATFVTQIGAVGERKNRSLTAVRECLEGKIANTNRDVLPREVWKLLAVPAMQLAGVTTRQMQAGLGNAYCGTGLYKQNISRERAARLAGVIKSDEL